MKELIMMLADSNVNFSKNVIRNGNNEITRTEVVISTDRNGATTTFAFGSDEKLISVSHN